MQANLTPRTVWHHQEAPLDVRSDDTASALTLGERVLLSVALEAVCLVAQANQLVDRARPRRADRRGAHGASRSGW